MNMLVRVSRKSFLVLEFFNGLSALAGGIGLILNPDGKALGMNVEMLSATPFESFLILGIVLFVVNGLGNITGAVLTLRKHNMSAYVAAFLGFVLMVWIVSQVAWIGYQSFLQPLYFITGLAQLILAYVFVVKNTSSE